MDEHMPPSRSLHHHLALPLPKGIRETGLVMFVDNIVEPRLAPELVHALRDFIASSIPEPWE